MKFLFWSYGLHRVTCHPRVTIGFFVFIHSFLWSPDGESVLRVRYIFIIHWNSVQIVINWHHCILNIVIYLKIHRTMTIWAISKLVFHHFQIKQRFVSIHKTACSNGLDFPQINIEKFELIPIWCKLFSMFS